jgi:hypothetical protein
MGWATFWAIFSPTHLVTLASSSCGQYDPYFSFGQVFFRLISLLPFILLLTRG